MNTAISVQSNSPNTQTQALELFPGNWLYNAGVVGFLRVLEEDRYIESSDICSKLTATGTLKLPSQVFAQLDIQNLHFSESARRELKIRGKNTYHPNYWQSPWGGASQFAPFVQALSQVQEDQKRCDFCPGGYGVNSRALLRQKFPAKFLSSINRFESRILAVKLGPALSEMPNGAWNLHSTMSLCDLCAYLLLYAPLSWVERRKNEHIFINAPSFKVMWALNHYAREVLSQRSSVREIFGLSLIQATLRTNLTLHRWTAHNVEVVVKQKDKIDFIQLPQEVVKLLNTPKVAQQVNRLKELTILSKVMNREFDWILDSAQRLMRITLKSERNKSDEKFITDVLPYQASREELSNTQLAEIAQDLLRLYAMIQETIQLS